MTTKKSVKAKAKRPAPAKKRTPAKKKSAALKTQPTAASVEAFIAKVPNETRRRDARKALALMEKVTGLAPQMWGPSIIGFGAYHYKYESGREGDMCMTGFSPRGNATVFYVIGGVADNDPLYAKLGKHTMGKSCLYVKDLDDIDLAILEKIIVKSLAYMKKTYKTA